MPKRLSVITPAVTVGEGGTGIATATAAGGIVYTASTTAYGTTAAGTTGQYLKSGVAGAPTWATLAASDLSDNSNIVHIAGTETVTGAKTFSGLTLFGGKVVGSTDNTWFAWSGGNETFGFSKKSGVSGKLAFGNAAPFAITEYAAQVTIDTAGTQTDRFTIANGGAVTIGGTVATGALTVTGAATVSTTLGVTGATTLGSTLNVGPAANQYVTIGGGAGNHGMEFGRQDNVASTPYIDFHSGATSVDYDARLIASGGSGAIGGGTLTVTAATVAVSGLTATTGAFSGAVGTGALTTTGAHTASTTITAGTGLIATTGNITASNGNIYARNSTASTGYMTLQPGDTTHIGILAFFAPNGNRSSYIGYNTGSPSSDVGDLNYNAGLHNFVGAMTVGTGLLTAWAGLSVLGGAVSLATALGIASGGTNSTATATAGGVGYGTGTAHAYTAAGSAGQVLTSNGASAPTWQTASGGSSADVPNGSMMMLMGS